jgi:drug/metabolite transporter (DMT)-like permease
LKFKELRRSGALIWPIIAAIGIGFSDTLSKRIINTTMDFSFLFSLAIVQIFVSLIYLRIEKQRVSKSIKEVMLNFNLYKNVVSGSLFSIIGTGLLWVSFSKTLASIASPITATSGAIVVLLAIIFLDEKISIRSVLGLMLVFIGIMGITLLYNT